MSEDYAEQLQHLASAALPGDEDPAGVTRRQLQKVTAILQALAAGQSMWREALGDLITFLEASIDKDDAAARTARGLPTQAEAWARLDAWPWPATELFRRGGI